MPIALEPLLTELVTAYRTNEEVERSLRRLQRRDPALARLADDVHSQRAQIALKLLAFPARGGVGAFRVRVSRAQVAP